MRKTKMDRLFYGDEEIGSIEANGRVHDVQNQEGIEPIIKAFPFYLCNALPEGERYETLLLHSPHPVHSPVDAAKNVDELPGKFSINMPQRRVYTPFPAMADEVVYVETNLPVGMFFVNSEVRTSQKPSFSGYQDKFTAKTGLIDGKLTVSQIDPQKEYANTIVKPGIKLPGIAQNEFVCMRLARDIGLEVPRSFLIRVPGDKLPGVHFCVERFDFTKLPPFEKKNMLEFASLMELVPENKYLAKTEELFECAEKYLEPSDVKKLANAYFYGILTGNGDMHTKNFSVFVDKNATFRLAPTYDMVNTKVHGFKDMLALPFGESSNPNPSMKNMVGFLEHYISKNEMYQMAQMVEEKLPKVLELGFSQDTHKRFAHSLERSILDCVHIAKATIEYQQ
jgi:hypothetical protein